MVGKLIELGVGGDFRGVWYGWFKSECVEEGKFGISRSSWDLQRPQVICCWYWGLFLSNNFCLSICIWSFLEILSFAVKSSTQSPIFSSSPITQTSNFESQKSPFFTWDFSCIKSVLYVFQVFSLTNGVWNRHFWQNPVISDYSFISLTFVTKRVYKIVLHWPKIHYISLVEHYPRIGMCFIETYWIF